MRYLVVSKDVRRHRLISSDYIKTLRCHGRGRESSLVVPANFSSCDPEPQQISASVQIGVLAPHNPNRVLIFANSACRTGTARRKAIHLHGQRSRDEMTSSSSASSLTALHSACFLDRPRKYR